ncbi:MAG: hypothetical protein JWN55_3029 [Frankiales bacterium]|nr:hypothetical protein [Frankiales bacterium]
MAGKGPAHDDVRTALTAQYGVLVGALAELDPSGPTDCAGWTVADLESHLALTARSLAGIAAYGSTGPADGGGVADWAARLPALAAETDRSTKAERLALAPHADAATAALVQYGEDTVVEQLTGRHTLKEAALFRLVEAVVHGLDAGITPDRRALKIVVKELARAFADAHPGRTVELRVPPYAAVQCLTGPRHTRGTPPNVVEAAPVAWVRVATGRQSWAELVRDGSIRASGERADLSAFLPLLT